MLPEKERNDNRNRKEEMRSKSDKVSINESEVEAKATTHARLEAVKYLRLCSQMKTNLDSIVVVRWWRSL
jgi:hypothetical protein